MMTLSEALGCSEDEANERWALRKSLEAFGSHWAKDFERAAALLDDQAAQLPLNDQPQFAFLRGRSSTYRQLAYEIRQMASTNLAVAQRIQEANQGE